MTLRILPIVEGKGEVEAVPLLLRRLAADLGTFVQIDKPWIFPRTQLHQEGRLERTVEAAIRTAGPSCGILILLDADRDCPATLAPRLLERLRGLRPGLKLRVVLAKAEFESWFLAAAESLRGRRELRQDLVAPQDPEGIRDAKGWLSRHKEPASSYRETVDQPALCQALDLELAKRAPSFAKLCRDFASLVEGHER